MNVYNISPSTLIFESFRGGVRPVRLSLNPRLTSFWASYAPVLDIFESSVPANFLTYAPIGIELTQKRAPPTRTSPGPAAWEPRACLFLCPMHHKSMECLLNCTFFGGISNLLGCTVDVLLITALVKTGSSTGQSNHTTGYG